MVRQRRTQAGGAALGLCAAAGLIGIGGCLSGCSGTGAAADARPPADPASTVHRAADALAHAGSSRASTSMEMATGGTRVTIRGEGVYDFRGGRGRLRVVLPQDPAGEVRHRPILELLVPGALYMKNRGAGVPADKWVRFDTAAMSDGNLVTGGATDPRTAALLLRGARDVTYLGPDEVAGVPVRHYRGTVDLRRVVPAVAPGERGPVEAAAKGFSSTLVPFDVYLDDQGLVRKLRQHFSFDAGHGRPVAVASTTLLYGFGEPVDVRLPDDADIFAGRIAEQAE